MTDFLPSFNLPDRPDSPVYQEVLREIQEGDIETSAADFRFWCEASFWFFCRYCTSLSEYICTDEGSDWYGKPWLDHQWLYDRCMAIQFDPPQPPILRLWPRFFLKSALVTQMHTLWRNATDSVEAFLPSGALDFTKCGSRVNTLILTFKVDGTGEDFVKQMKRECESNPKLAYHWPHVFYANPKSESPEWTQTSLRFRQAGNPKEPSVLVSGVLQMPTSGHYQDIKRDDIVVRETVTNPEMTKQIFSAMQDVGPLGHDNTRDYYVGTRWAVDDAYELGRRAGMFEIDHQDCYGPLELPAKQRTVPVMRSAAWLDQQKIKMGPYKFAAQFRNDPMAASEMRIDTSMFRWYTKSPWEERGNGNIYIIIDPARSTKKSADFTTILVVKYGADGYKYLLDMYRDRMALDEFQALVFHLCGDETAVMRRKPEWAIWGRGNWRPTNGSRLMVYEEAKGADRDVEHFRIAMSTWSFRFDIAAIPHDELPKEDRILSWVQELGSGIWFFPQGGSPSGPYVGHSPKGETRDTLAMFMEEEVARWTASGEIEHDDGLDAFGMIRKRNPEAGEKKPKLGDLLRFPDSGGATAAAVAILGGMHGTPESGSPAASIFGNQGRSAWAA